MEVQKLKASAFGVQVAATICLSFFATQTGVLFSWPSYTVANFTSNSTVLSYPMTSLDVSLFGSLSNLGGLAASPFCGYLYDKMGRKYGSVLFALPYVIAWLIITFTKNVVLILLAMTIAGIGICGQNISLIFLSELSHDSIRGGLTSCSSTGYVLGILISYLLGGYLTYYQVVYTHLALAIINVILLLLLRESPVYLMMVGKEEEAAKAISFYNQVEVNSKFVEIEMKKIRLQLDPRLEKLLESDGADLETADALLQTKFADNETQKESSWKMLRKSKSSKRALSAVLIIIATTIMMGSVVLQVYAEPLFKEAVPSMSASFCAIMLAVDLLIASLVCVLMIDKFGRKNLLIVTSSLSGVCTLLLGVQLQVHYAPHWFTALLIYLYTFVYTVGCAVVPFVLSAEVFLPEVRGLCNSFFIAFVWIFNFITLFIFNPLVELLGLGVVFYIFSAVCFLGTAYVYFKLPETKGLSADAIQLLFLKQK